MTQSRVILLVDMDCFYCQVEENLDPNLKGKPIAVVPYNHQRGGGIIAANYIARDKGVTKAMSGDVAKTKCPDIKLVQVPDNHGKADLTRYREAGKKVADVLKGYTELIERASIDEAYLDITKAVDKQIQQDRKLIFNGFDQCFVVGFEMKFFFSNIVSNPDFYEDDLKLLIGAVIAEQIRTNVYEETGYHCSAGIAHNKILAKLACGLNKPNKQTILPQHAVNGLFAKLPIKKIKSLGGKFGCILGQKLNIEFVGEVTNFPKNELIKNFGTKTGTWLYDIARGIDGEEVTTKLLTNSIACCKEFLRESTLTNLKIVQYWINELSSQLSERLEKDTEENKRKARKITLSFANEELSSKKTRSYPLKSHFASDIAENALKILEQCGITSTSTICVTYLGLSAGNFEEVKRIRDITSYFQNIPSADCGTPPKNYSQDGEVEIMKQARNSSNNLIENSPDKESTCIQDETENSKVFYNNFLLKSQVSHENPEEFCFYDSKHIAGNPETIILNNKDNTIGMKLNCVSPLSNIHKDSEAASTSDIPYSNIASAIENKEPITGNMDVTRNESNASEDSLSNELFLDITLESEKNRRKGSFFTHYFENLVRNSPHDRNFDTSKILEETDSNASIDNVISSNNSNNSIRESKLQKCEECGKNIAIDDVTAHMDYHFALSIVRKESASYSSQAKNSVEVCNKTKTKTNKRKAITMAKDSLLHYLAKEENPLEDTVICLECNKRIKISEHENHEDYHTAKKLHHEINSHTLSTNRNNSQSNKHSNNSNKTKCKSKGILSFFKQNNST